MYNLGRKPTASPPRNPRTLSINFTWTDTKGKACKSCTLSQFLSLQHRLMTTGKCNGSRRASGAPTTSRRETVKNSQVQSVLDDTDYTNQLTPVILHHMRHPREGNSGYSSFPEGKSRLWAIKSPSKIRLGVTSIHTGLYICTRFILYTLYLPQRKKRQ